MVIAHYASWTADYERPNFRFTEIVMYTVRSKVGHKNRMFSKPGFYGTKVGTTINIRQKRTRHNITMIRPGCLRRFSRQTAAAANVFGNAVSLVSPGTTSRWEGEGALNVCGAPRIRRRFYTKHTTTDGSCKRLRAVTCPIGLTDRVS